MTVYRLGRKRVNQWFDCISRMWTTRGLVFLAYPIDLPHTENTYYYRNNVVCLLPRTNASFLPTMNPRKFRRHFLRVLFLSTTNHAVHLHGYRVVQISGSPYFYLSLLQMLTDFHNSFIDSLDSKFATKTSLLIQPHLTGVATLPYETLMSLLF